ncbi:MAG: hypothetical protein ABSC02_03690 [Acidobacteriota bacterium]|jgi:hypothetical protein
MTKEPVSSTTKELSVSDLSAPAVPRYQAGHKIPHMEILKALQHPALGFSGIMELYRLRVLPVKTRNLQLLGRKSPARIIETLLGYEVKASYKRIHCPDKVTARYVRLFSELGCRTIRIPYDPTVTAELIPYLEQAVASIENGVRELFPKDHGLQLYVLRKLYSHLRIQLKAAGRNLPSERAPDNPPVNAF